MSDCKPEGKAIYTCDSLDKVAKCLSCTRPKCKGRCDDVMDSCDRAKKRYKMRMRESMLQIAQFVRAGKKDEFIMQELGITKAQLSARKRHAREGGIL